MEAGMNLNLLEGQSYTSNLVWSFIEGLKSEKEGHAWTVRKDGLLEDAVGSVYAIDLLVTSEEVRIKLKPVDVVNF
jgi:hypothetical protein